LPSADIPTLQQVSAKLILVGGPDSRDSFPYQATVALADLLGEKLIEFPGDHIGYRHHSGEFARRLRGLLAPQRLR
jgi:hypothetical protein